jgi:hypothetical protein
MTQTKVEPSSSSWSASSPAVVTLSLAGGSVGSGVEVLVGDSVGRVVFSGLLVGLADADGDGFWVGVVEEGGGEPLG